LHGVVVEKLVCVFTQFRCLARRPSVWTAFLFPPYPKSPISIATVLYVWFTSAISTDNSE